MHSVVVYTFQSYKVAYGLYVVLLFKHFNVTKWHMAFLLIVVYTFDVYETSEKQNQ